MALSDRSNDIILRAQIDQALKPMADIIQRVKDLTQVLQAQEAAAKSGDTTIAQYAKALRDVDAASSDLLKTRALLDEFSRRQDTVSTRQAEADAKRLENQAKLAALPPPGERTNAQENTATRLGTALDNIPKRLASAQAAFQATEQELLRLGVITEDVTRRQEELNAAHAKLSTSITNTSAARASAGAQNDTLIQTLRQAGIEKQIAEQRQRDTARFVADQEAQRRAVEETADAIRAQGAAAQRGVNDAAFTSAVRAGRGISQADIEAAFKADDDARKAEAALAAQRAQDATAFQGQQSRLQAAVRAVWDEEDKGAAKAREAVLAFQADVEKTLGQLAAARANAAAQTAGVAAPVGPGATPLAAQVREALATPSGGGVGLSDLTSLQRAVAQVSDGVTSGRVAMQQYSQAIRDLDAIGRATLAQSQIVDSFLKQKKAAEDATSALQKAVQELDRLHAAAETATPDNLSEVTSAIAAKNKQIGSIEANTGLAAQARAAVEALAREQDALHGIGIMATEVGQAMQDLTSVAVTASKTRQAMTDKERASLEALADAATHKAMAAVGAVPASASALSAVQSAGVSKTENIEDIGTSIDALDKRIGNAKVTAAAFNRQMEQLFNVQRQIASDAGLIDQFRAQEAAQVAAQKAYAEARSEVIRLAEAAKAGTADVSQLAAAEARLDSAIAGLQKANAGQQQADAALKARKIDTANLTVETDKLVASSARLSAIQSRSSQGNGTVFGLSTYQLQNLSFQVNDVITQLSLGQGLARTFASQGGQIFQIFETSISAMQRMVLYGGPAAAVLGVIVLALLRVKDTLDTQREFSRLLAASADGAAYSARELTELTRTMERLGISMDDAKTATKAFIIDGLSTQSMLQFARTAKQISDVTGGDFADALKQVGIIAHGSLDDILKLDQQLNFLSAAEAQQIRANFEAGQAADGRSVAINSLTTAMQRGVKEGLNPGVDAFRELRTAWHDFLDSLADTGLIRGVIAALKGLSIAAREVSRDISYILGNASPALTEKKVNDLRAALEKTKAQIDDFKAKGLPDDVISFLEKRAADLTNQLRLAVVEKDKLAAGGGHLPGVPEVTSDQGLGGPFSRLPPPDSRVNKPIDADIKPIIDAVSTITGVSVYDIAALYRNEARRLGGVGSDFETNKESGATGPLQLLPGTFNEMVAKFRGLFDQLSATLGKKVDINDPNFNILAGSLYYKEQLGNFGQNPLAAAGAYNAGPAGFRNQLAGQGSAKGIAETTQYVSNFAARQTGDTNLPGYQTADVGEALAKRVSAALQDITKHQADVLDETLRGSARGDQDARRVAEYIKTRNQEVAEKYGPASDTPEVRAALNSEFEAFRKHLTDERTRQQQEADNATLQIVKQAQLEVDKADKTNPVAQRRAVDEEFAARLSALNEQIAHGASDVLKGQAESARSALLALKDKALENASVAADRAVVDDLVKARDDLIKEVETGLKNGSLTVQEAFRRIQLAIQQFNPAITKAVGQSNTDLAGQQQTPAVQAQLAKNAAVDTKGSAAISQADEAAQQRIDALLAARAGKVKELNDEVSQGTLTQRQSDAATLKTYADYAKQLNPLLRQLQDQIDLQKQLGQISPEVYEKLSSAIKKAKTSNDDLTDSQKKLAQAIENSVVSRALEGINTITNAIGAAIAGTGKWSDAVKSLGVGFAQFAAGVLKDIAEMIIKQELLNAIQSAGGVSGIIGKLGGLFSAGAAAAGGAGAIGGGFGVAGNTDFFAGMTHTGGIVGATNMSRPINPSAWIGAPRMHTGGLLGLSPGEVPYIGKVGEEVLADDNPRHQKNFMGGSASATMPQSLKNVLLFKDEDVAGAMAGAVGESVTLTHIRRNGPAIRQLLGIKG